MEDRLVAAILTDVSIDDCARELLLARASRSLLPPPSRRDPDFSMMDGYAVSQRLHQEALNSGCATTGLKLGFTNTAVWSELGLDSPFWAPIYDRTVVAAGEISLTAFVAPRLEPEIVVGFGSNLEPGAGPREISAAIAWAAAGFEIVQCHYPDWEMRPPDAVADAGLHGALMVGEQIPLEDGDATKLTDVVVEIQGDENIVAEGRGENALGGPVKAIAWLLRLPGVDPIRPGTVVTTGSLTPALPIAPGQTWQLTTSGPVALGELIASFS